MRLISILLFLSLAACQSVGRESVPTPDFGLAWLMDTTMSKATAFPIDCDGKGVFFATARHAAEDGCSVLSQNGVHLKNGKVVWRHKKEDIAVLYFKTKERPPIARLRKTPLPIGTPVLLVGYPLGELHITDGYTSGEMRISTPAAPGSSGSPVMDLQGYVIGVLIHVAWAYSPGIGRQLFPHLSRLVPVDLLPPLQTIQRPGSSPRP